MSSSTSPVPWLLGTPSAAGLWRSAAPQRKEEVVEEEEEEMLKLVD